MRSVNRKAAAALALALAGCGNYSTEDLRFLAALPTREDLQVAVPAPEGGAANALSASALLDPCPPASTAEVWLWAKPTSDGLNKGVGFIISLIDVVRRFPPTARGEDYRRWGPFPDEQHPGHETQIVLTRSFPSGPDAPVHNYGFESRPVGAPTFEPLLVGTFEGPSSSRGRGLVVLDFEAFWDAGIADSTTPHGQMEIEYHRDSDPATIRLQVTTEGFQVVPFEYGYAGWADARGAFYYKFRNEGGDTLTVATSYGAAGFGRGRVWFVGAGGSPYGNFNQCWDSRACLTYVDDPSNLSCPAHTSCSFGDKESCPAPPDVPVDLSF
jgi:hypothetical protein